MNIYNLLQKQVEDEHINKLIIGGVVKIEDKYLILKRNNNTYLEGLYEIPNGRMEFGETIEECIYRQIEEKTGCKVKTIENYVGHFDYVSNDGKKARQYNFLVTIEDLNNIKLSEKHSNYKIATISECENNLNISDETILILKIANTFTIFKKINEVKK